MAYNASQYVILFVAMLMYKSVYTAEHFVSKRSFLSLS
jgi:hypothetical protein